MDTSSQVSSFQHGCRHTTHTGSNLCTTTARSRELQPCTCSRVDQQHTRSQTADSASPLQAYGVTQQTAHVNRGEMKDTFHTSSLTSQTLNKDARIPDTSPCAAWHRYTEAGTAPHATRLDG
jgi:hypothetical protein